MSVNAVTQPEKKPKGKPTYAGRTRRPGGTYARPIRIGKRIAYLLEAGFVYMFYGFFAVLPLDWASGIGGWIGRTVGPRLAASKKALRNIQNAFPDNSDADNRVILRDMWDNLGRVMAEYPHLERIKDRVEIVGQDHIDAVLAQNRGAVVVAGHLANWETQPLVAKINDVNLCLVYRKPNNPYLDGLLLRARGAGSDTHIPKSMEGMREMVRVLRKGGYLGLLVDQKFNEGIPVPFFGRDAMTFTTPATLALKYGVEIIPVQTERLSGARFRITVHPPININKTGSPDADIENIMTKINNMMEDWVRQNPGQWLWLHRRWPDQRRQKKNNGKQKAEQEQTRKTGAA